jgi:hypothetical protein
MEDAGDAGRIRGGGWRGEMEFGEESPGRSLAVPGLAVPGGGGIKIYFVSTHWFLLEGGEGVWRRAPGRSLAVPGLAVPGGGGIKIYFVSTHWFLLEGEGGDEFGEESPGRSLAVPGGGGFYLGDLKGAKGRRKTPEMQGDLGGGG